MILEIDLLKSAIKIEYHGRDDYILIKPMTGKPSFTLDPYDAGLLDILNEQICKIDPADCDVVLNVCYTITHWIEYRDRRGPCGSG